MEERIIDRDLTLVPYYPNGEVSLKWYQNLDVCRQVDNIDHVYTPELLARMYEYLHANGLCYYIRYNGQLVGDVTLQNSGEISIVVCKEFQNRHIGRRCVMSLLELAKQRGMKEIRARIYAFNTQSQAMFRSVGFRQVDDELYSYVLR